MCGRDLSISISFFNFLFSILKFISYKYFTWLELLLYIFEALVNALFPCKGLSQFHYHMYIEMSLIFVHLYHVLIFTKHIS